MKRQRRHHAAELKQLVRAYLHRIQQWPEQLSHGFWPSPVKYQASDCNLFRFWSNTGNEFFESHGNLTNTGFL